MPQHYLQLLDAFLADPHQSIHRANLLAAKEKERLLVAWNDTAAPRQPTQCLHHLFEAQVKRTPAAVAVTTGSQQLTYQDLNQRANQLAHYLKKQGVGAETLVGICMERSLEMVVGLMGILKAGGGYVPLDPTYPKERLAFIAEDAQVSILLSQSKLLGSLPPTKAQIIDLEADWGHILQESAQNPNNAVKGDNVVYVMYTSGSTGKPKGVVVLHRGVCNYLLWRKSYFPLDATDRVLQKTSFSFVDSVWELYEPLMVGAQLIMAEPDRHYDPSYLVKFIIEQKITAADFIPSLLQLFLEEPNVAQCTSLRRVTTGSETVTVDLQSQFYAKLKANLYNLYGPTEASIASTCWPCQAGDDKRSVPIGRPIANTQIYLLDKYLQPVPLGIPGEVHIGGIGLARGYLNRPEMTAEKFISNPFSDDPEARLYKTGDLARYLVDGDLEFLGRIDHQVKIRGYRIELGEIEAFLRQHGAVQKAVALVREDRPGDKRLVAYVVPEAKQAVEVSQLRHYLQQKLPDYMVPSAFVSLDALPLTPNGKVDRRALPAPDATRPELAETFVAPEGPVEEKLAEMWQQVLGLKKVGVHDNFFELGGHSLIAARLFSKIQREFGRQLPLATLFQAPTIAQISTFIEQKEQKSNWSSLVPIRASGTRPPLFFIHAHGGNVVGYYELAQYLGDDQPFYGLQAQGLNGIVNTKIGRFEDMATHYIKDIRQVQPQGPYFLGGWCYGGNLAFEMAQQLQAQGEEVALLAMVQSTPHSYPQYPPNATFWQRAFYKGIRRINLEIDWLAEAKPNARTAHLRERGKRLTTIIQTQLEKSFRPLLAKFNITLLPSQASRFEELGDRHMSLWYRYEIKPYQGNVTLFRAEKQPLGIIPDPTLGWGGIIKGELEIHEIPGHRLGILSEPRVLITAAKLKAALKKAQIS
ncbi:MAG: amino acid adenylation domain-containing protein [Anaerolineae bacterium]|nr:amino acid adenylation domain-containing protein [Anaerolineae bacterium]